MELNIARFDLVSIRLAVLCAESGSLTAAARLAHCSLSAASQRLSALEDALGKTLFLRDHRGLRLTEAGHLFVRHAHDILNHFEVLRCKFAEAETSEMHLTLEFGQDIANGAGSHVLPDRNARVRVAA
jgi:DNA-binding transcriptional LysR family regulator